MGGYGSGPEKRRDSNSGYLRLSIDKLLRGGFLEPGAVCLWTWTLNVVHKSSINITALAGRVRLSFRVKENGGEWQVVEQEVMIDRTPCNFGGTRPWFLCPKCGRRVSVLYGKRAFYCRACHLIAYESQSESCSERCYRRANKLRQRMGGEPGGLSGIPKPRWMRWSTYERTVREIERLENAGFIASMRKFPTLSEYLLSHILWEVI